MATTEGRVQYVLGTTNWRRTVCARSDCDDNGQRPIEDKSEENKCDDDVDKCGNDVEKYELQVHE